MTPLRILAFSTIFPNSEQARHGIFLRHRLIHLARQGGCQIHVVAPVPYFPFRDRFFGFYSVYGRVPRSNVDESLNITHPRFLCVPKVGMSFAAIFMALSMVYHFWKLRRSGFEFDLIDSYYLYPDGVAATILGWVFGKPVILTAFGSDVSELPKYFIPRRAILWAATRSKHITAVCGALRDELVRIGVHNAKIQVILHGVDLDLFIPPRDRSALRQQLGFNRPTILSVGHLIRRKGHDVAICAMPLLPNYDLHIIGDGPLNIELRQLAINLKVEHRVHFHGHVSQQELPALFGAADVLVNCSSREGIANVLLESMACGTPVAATRVWGSPEIVTNLTVGILLDDHSARGLARGIQRLLAGPLDRGAIRSYAERYPWNDTAVRHLELAHDATTVPNTHTK
jgi:teichuronic acid biosynthesis glycosyltransferase TuaC